MKKYCVTIVRTGCVFVEAENEAKAKIDSLHNKNLFKTQPIPSFIPIGVRIDDVL